MKILALDLGTKLGWARHHKTVTAGTLLLSPEKDLREAKKLRLDRRLDLRATFFSHWLESQTANLVVFEDIRWASSQAQAHLWGTLRGVLWSWAARKYVTIDCLDSSKLKKWTTGSGAADKQDMLNAATARWPELIQSSWDDNAIDAFCLLQWAQLKQLSLEET